MNAANEVAVARFLKGEISFTQIPNIIGKTLRKYRPLTNGTLNGILWADQWARTEATRIK